MHADIAKLQIICVFSPQLAEELYSRMVRPFFYKIYLGQKGYALTSVDFAGSDGDAASGTLPGAKPLKPPGSQTVDCFLFF